MSDVITSAGLPAHVKILGLSGKRGSGKTTVANMIEDIIKADNATANILQVAFAHALKRLLLFMYPSLVNPQDPHLDTTESKSQILPRYYSTDTFDMDSAFAVMLQQKDDVAGQSLKMVANMLNLDVPSLVMRVLAAIDAFTSHCATSATPLTVGQALQFLGTDCMRKYVNDNIWIAILKCYIMTQRDVDYVIISDCRMENELSFFKPVEDRKVALLRIEASTTPSSDSTGRDANHLSETALDQITFELTLKNDGTLDDLRTKVQAFAVGWL